MDIHYTLTFFSEWHCGSGLAAGADVDALVVKDRDGLPYVPGKSIKGLVREAVETLMALRGTTDALREAFVEAFGNAAEADWDMLPDAADTKMRRGASFFTNAELSAPLRLALRGEELKQYLYRPLSFTALDAEGIAVDHSLRRIEAVVPCELQGMITDLPQALAPTVADALRFIKRMGLNRNRGLGRCQFDVVGGASHA
jgi:hypothetical protein